MTSKTNHEVGASLNRIKQVDGANRAARPSRDAILHGKQKRGNMEAIGKTTRHDTLHALVPALAAYDDHATAVIAGLGKSHGFVGELALDISTILVDLFELGSESRRLHGIGRH